MSSEGSVTSTASRIRQFGLYRTIDARTDEFLRSSRRRQIRQGCACAAISTAITVTVVVSVILVYEYSINSESNVNKKLTVKPNWLGLMNETDTTQSDLKFEKKINFDRTTLKLLPILIKALNKNRYLEKIIEDYSSSSPPYEEGNETENYFQRNIFSNSKNWLKMPSSKGYTIDYKSSPSLYTRRPTVYSDYLSRIRKLRNYKRMLNNFDKVISERTSYSKPSQTPKTVFAYTEMPLKSVTHRIKPNKTKPVKATIKKKSNHVKITMIENLLNKSKNVSEPVSKCSKIENKKLDKHKGYCKCPKDMGILLNKLIQSIKEIIPTMTNKNQSQSSCPNKEKNKRNKKKTSKKSRIQGDIIIPTTQQGITKSTTLKILIKPMKPVAIKEEVYHSATEPVNVKNIMTPQAQTDMIDLPAFKFDHDITTELITKSPLNTSTSESTSYVTASNIDKKKSPVIANNRNIYINTIQAHKNILEEIPMYGTYDLKDLNYEISTSNAQDKSISNNINKKSTTTTELIMPLKLNSNEGSLSSENFLDSVAVVSNYKHPIRPLLNDKEYEDYYLTTERTPNDFDDLDVHSFELVKTKNVISSPTKYGRNGFRNNMKKIPITSRNYHPVAKSKDIDQINMRKMADLINIPKTVMDQENIRRISSVYEDESFGNTTFISRNDEETGLLKNVIKISKSETLSKSSYQPLSKTESVLLQAPEGDQNNENTNEDEFQEEWTKNTEITESTVKFNKSIFDDEPQTSQNNYESKSHDKINSVKSMLPAIRPVYLEIRRSNDWKTEDHTDYDVILLIYEYTIAVEWTLVQNKEDVITKSEVKNQPMADRLDRTYFGFDQEYFEKMPLLINALQENNHIDPTLEMTDLLGKRKRFNATVLKTTTKPTFKPSAVRRTSPRPFYFEYRHPTPLPFSKTYGSRSWVERYRNEERLKNIRQIIKYLENTIHAKVGDMYAKPTEKHVAFTGFYIEPMLESKNEEPYKSDLLPASSDIKKRYLNHLADPLFNFKPENPGDVNLLAEEFLRFAPVATPGIVSKTNEYPMFRQIPLKNRNCHGNKCEEIIKGNNKLFPRSTVINQTETPPLSTTKSFSVMLNLFPIKAKSENLKQDVLKTTQALDKIYLTTSRPLLQFKRKSNISVRRIYTPYKRPKYLSNLINKDSKSNKTKETPGTQMIVHVKVYNEPQIKNETSEKHSTTSIPVMQTNPYTTKAPIEFSTSQIEDYHVGSSGYIPVPDKTDKFLPKVTTMFNFFDSTTEYSNTASTQTTSVVKFNIEDAKTPNHYLNLNTQVSKGDINRRNSMEFIDHEELLKPINTNENLKLNGINLSNPIESSVENNTLIVKLKNNFSNNMAESIEANTEEITTSVKTYVPQINGHYRSINQNSRNVNKWLNDEPESDRKTRLQNVVSGIRTYVPMYVEIKRNNSKTSNIEDSVTTTQATKN